MEAGIAMASLYQKGPADAATAGGVAVCVLTRAPAMADHAQATARAPRRSGDTTPRRQLRQGGSRSLRIRPLWPRDLHLSCRPPSAAPVGSRWLIRGQARGDPARTDSQTGMGW